MSSGRASSAKAYRLANASPTEAAQQLPVLPSAIFGISAASTERFCRRRLSGREHRSCSP